MVDQASRNDSDAYNGDNEVELLDLLTGDPALLTEGILQPLEVLLVESSMSPSERYDWLSRTRDNARSLRDLLVRVRYLAGLSPNDDDPIDDTGSFCDRVSRLINGYKPRASRVDVGISSNVQCAPTSSVDFDALRHVLSALLDHAVRVSPFESTISVSVNCNADECVCTVEHQSPVVDPVDGTPHDVDLAIARRIVTRHGGQFVVENRAEGWSYRLALPVPAGAAL